MKLLIPLGLLILTCCINDRNNGSINKNYFFFNEKNLAEAETLTDSNGNFVYNRLRTPSGFIRTNADFNSFAHYLRHLPLKPHGAIVRLFNGDEKPNHEIYVGVVDLPIGRKNLHQCADAIIRLRAEWLFKKGDFNNIAFNFTNGFRAEYAKWREGNRIVVSGNKVQWVNGTQRSTSYIDFWSYLEMVFTYAGTQSLNAELKSISVEEMRIGDIFIQGGSPGHAVIIVDMAQNPQTGEKIFLLAQSYMPAQEIHILTNPNKPNLTPWYNVKENTNLVTPEWTFHIKDLKRFP